MTDADQIYSVSVYCIGMQKNRWLFAIVCFCYCRTTVRILVSVGRFVWICVCVPRLFWSVDNKTAASLHASAMIIYSCIEQSHWYCAEHTQFKCVNTTFKRNLWKINNKRKLQYELTMCTIFLYLLSMDIMATKSVLNIKLEYF